MHIEKIRCILYKWQNIELKKKSNELEGKTARNNIC